MPGEEVCVKMRQQDINSPNLWITVTYENMGAMQQTKEKYDAINKIMAERFSETDEEYNTISKSYEEIRKMVDHQIINRVNFK